MVILVIFGCLNIIDKIFGLELGVDDYLVKLFEILEFIVWVCVLLWWFKIMVKFEMKLVYYLVGLIIDMFKFLIIDLDGK